MNYYMCTYNICVKNENPFQTSLTAFQSFALLVNLWNNVTRIYINELINDSLPFPSCLNCAERRESGGALRAGGVERRGRDGVQRREG